MVPMRLAVHMKIHLEGRLLAQMPNCSRLIIRFKTTILNEIVQHARLETIIENTEIEFLLLKIPRSYQKSL